ncbi:MAG: DUF4198 domain-containing protein [Chthoniobacterales bacterium]|nr:DUF4198 domain-containing protein [Chthoniobacterales bacterium]
MRTHFLLPLVVFAALSTTSFAHDTWLSPSTYAAPVGQTVTFELTSGMEFPALDAAIKPERVAEAGFRLRGEEGELKEFNSGEHALRTERAFAQEGVATVWLQLSPKDIELTDDDVAHYLEEVRASEEVQRAWAAQKGSAKWKELYTKCAKTCVAIGKTEGDDSWARPVGMSLEFVPVDDPTRLRVGQQARFKLLRNGEPLANTAVALHAEGDKAARYETTDAQGVVTFPLEQPGPAMIATVHLRPPVAEKPWQSEFSTFTFDVKGE